MSDLLGFLAKLVFVAVLTATIASCGGDQSNVLPAPEEVRMIETPAPGVERCVWVKVYSAAGLDCQWSEGE